MGTKSSQLCNEEPIREEKQRFLGAEIVVPMANHDAAQRKPVEPITTEASSAVQLSIQRSATASPKRNRIRTRRTAKLSKQRLKIG